MYNNNLDYYYVEMVKQIFILINKRKGKIHETFQKHDEERIEIIKDSIMKMFVYEISGIRNLQYDIDKLTQVLDFF